VVRDSADSVWLDDAEVSALPGAIARSEESSLLIGFATMI